MSHDVPGVTALQAAIAASRESSARNTAAAMAGSSRIDVALRGVDAAALGLLCRLRKLLAGVAVPVVQFVPCGDAADGGSVAHAFARATAVAWGRTLLINARPAVSAGTLPDAFVPRLYHVCLSGADLYGMLSQSSGAGTPAASMFNILVIDQASPSEGGSACDAAPFCTGTVLVVQAGRTELASITAAAGRIAAMGGTVLGTVLAGAPAWAQ